MNRRELLKSLAPLTMVPLVVKGEKVGEVAKIDPSAKYVIFVDARSVDARVLIEQLSGTAEYPSGTFPGGTPVHSVYPFGDQTIDDTIRIFKVDP